MLLEEKYRDYLNEGKEIGKELGRSEGEKESLSRVVKKMLGDDMDKESIAKYSGLSLDEIQIIAGDKR